MIKWLRRLICGECKSNDARYRSIHDKWIGAIPKSKYAPERDINTVQTGGYTPKGSEPKPINPPRRPLPPSKE